MAPPPAKKPGGKLDLSRKIGPLPMWGWLAVAVVGVVIYRKLSGGSSSSGSTTSSTSGTVPTETITTGGGSYSGPVGYAPGSVTNPGGGATSTDTSTPGSTGSSTPGSGGNSTPAAAWAAPTGEVQVGAGYYNPGGAPITDASGGRYQWVTSPATANALKASGQPLYFQPQPGVFVQQNYGAGGGVASGTPTYSKV